MASYVPPGLGWRLDPPDVRDYLPSVPAVVTLLDALPTAPRRSAAHCGRVDLREFFPEVLDQGPLHSSTIHACLALVQYFEARAGGRQVLPSRLFLYKLARKLDGVSGDVGATFRATLKAIKSFGLPPEQYWPYDPGRFDDEPDPFLYALGAARYRQLSYVRLDARNVQGADTLLAVKAFLSAGFPVALGFSVPGSLAADGDIPFRPRFDFVRGGQSVVAVGYDDRRQRSTRGALLVRNSWGPRWGEQGYGWLPYIYLEEQLACDCWTVLQTRWLESGEFVRPQC